MMRGHAVLLAAVLAAAWTHAYGGSPSPPPSPAQTPQSPSPEPSGSADKTQSGPPQPGQFVIGDNNVVRLPASATSVTASNIGGIEKLGPEEVRKYAASFSIADNGIARGAGDAGALKFLTPEYIGRSGTNGLTWRVPIEGSAPGGTSQSRFATITLGVPPTAGTYAVEYSLTTKPAAAAQWSVRGSADTWTISWDDPPAARVYGLLIENQDERLSNVRLALSTLKDASGRALGLDRVRLVRPGANPQPVQKLEVAPLAAEPVFIEIQRHDGADVFGTYDGMLRFTADGSSALKDLQLKIQVSSSSRKIVGFLLTLLGLLLAMLVAAMLRPQLARLQVRRATAGLRRSLADFLDEVNRTLPAEAPSTVMKATATRLSHSLSDATLDQRLLLPPAFSLPGAEVPTELPSGLKTLLEEASGKTEALFVLLRSGAPRLLGHLARDRDTALDLLRQLDEASAEVKDGKEADEKVVAIHEKITADKESALLAPGRRTDVEELDLRINALSLAAWSVWLVVALATAAAWIASDADYGTTMDLVSSFLWGFGITAFGASVQNLTPAQIATHVNLKLPK